MTEDELRDQIAIHAATVFLAGVMTENDDSNVAKRAYRFADKMIAERASRPKLAREPPSAARGGPAAR